MKGDRRQVPDVDRLAHLFVIGRVGAESFSRPGGGSDKRRLVNRQGHGTQLAGEASAALAAQDSSRELIDDDELRATGSIIVIEGSDALYALKLESLDRANGWWLLLSVNVNGDGVEEAVVWVSDQNRHRFLKLFDDYLAVDTLTGKPRNEPLVANIGRIRTSLLRDLWQSDGEPPYEGTHWWEVWLRKEDGAESLLRSFAQAQGLQVSRPRMELDQRTIMWVRGPWSALILLPATAVPIAEIRRGQFTDTLEDLEVDDQVELVTDLADRLNPSGSDAPAVCLLDTGTRRNHALLAASLDATDWHSVTSGGPEDLNGHGTLMAGLALLGPIDQPLLSSGIVQLIHRLESVKLLPDTGQHDARTYGLVTAKAVSAPEVASHRRRVLCMPVTAPHDRNTDPSLWSASIDALAAGTDIGLTADDEVDLIGPPNPAASRLFVISAGNAPLLAPLTSYLDNCDVCVVEDPAQAWNVLVVGACTSLTSIPSDPSFHGWSALATSGDLSPHSRTGLLIPPKWPIRPDLCMEGGNVLTNGLDLNAHHPVVCLATTGHLGDTALSTANATSAATAQVSRLAARAMATYPSYWPETIRGLLVHSAEWTQPMQQQIAVANSVAGKRAVLGRYGWGIPDETALLTSGRRTVTMVVQDEFVPFTGLEYSMRQFRLHRLPWPKEILAGLGAAEVRLKVTLSYFIEPSAARRGWRNRYAYASHGLRFELKNTTENEAAFIERVNRRAGREEGGGTSSSSGVDRWLIGPQTRNSGSLHQDIWLGAGADLAECGLVAVHPIGGWWKNGSRRDRRELPVRYSLIVSLATDEQGVDIYEPIAIDLEVPVRAVAIEA